MSELFCPHCGGKLGMYLVALVGGSEGAVANGGGVRAMDR